jgi:uncharacterized membrane protein YoaK (UPF0700 family)
MKENEKIFAWGVFGGALIGLFTGNLGLWISLGLIIGAGVSAQRKNKKDNNTEKE